MSKFYWDLRGKGCLKKYQITYIVTHFKPELRTYPSNRWGYGYWINKHRRNNNG